MEELVVFLAAFRRIDTPKVAQVRVLVLVLLLRPLLSRPVQVFPAPPNISLADLGAESGNHTPPFPSPSPPFLFLPPSLSLLLPLASPAIEGLGES